MWRFMFRNKKPPALDKGDPPSLETKTAVSAETGRGGGQVYCGEGHSPPLGAPLTLRTVLGHLTRSTWTLAGYREPPAWAWSAAGDCGDGSRGLALVLRALPAVGECGGQENRRRPGPGPARPAPRGAWSREPREEEVAGLRGARWPRTRGTEDARAAAPEAAETVSRKGRRALALERGGYQFQKRTDVFCLLLGTCYRDRSWPGKGKLALFSETE
ncbi:unnamed protein product [Rangifer tarandus platyrhynchus]|uniref:Uncharacterized protein n=1 Tax=Rangifer tarandus platyrhynchus TaxID=3082113 RepID=A0ABN8ZPR8_RANTA|nr:unnamed protein product [Rangifer tarandus platyrhynchus]